jgi:hypothetical protein
VGLIGFIRLDYACEVDRSVIHLLDVILVVCCLRNSTGGGALSGETGIVVSLAPRRRRLRPPYLNMKQPYPSPRALGPSTLG